MILSLLHDGTHFHATIQRAEGTVDVTWQRVVPDGKRPTPKPTTGTMGGRNVRLTQDEVDALQEAEGRV